MAKTEEGVVSLDPVELSEFLPKELLPLDNPQTDIPRIARDEILLRRIEESVQRIPTRHQLNLGDARAMDALVPESVHLVVTSPPYWTLKEYRQSSAQMGHIGDYDEFVLPPHPGNSGVAGMQVRKAAVRPLLPACRVKSRIKVMARFFRKERIEIPRD